MAKDPAFLFYPNDWIGGTMGMSFEEKGAYMELLMMQFNRGHMTYDMMAHTVGRILDKILDKFIKDEKGLYYNARLDEEKIKRKRFVDSRLNNKKGTNQHSKNEGHTAGHMTSDMENVNNNKEEESLIKKNSSSNSIGEDEEKLFPMARIYKLGWDKYKAILNGQARYLTEEIYNEWKSFVDFVYEKNFDELFQSKFITPIDFGKLMKQNEFPRSKWELILKKILATGVKPEHNLFFRIPEFITYEKSRNIQPKSRSDKQSEQHDFLREEKRKALEQLGCVGASRV